ncbi:hypothetical protein GCM10025771_21950 [Niveibacterium umoris]|uniref:Uncharacterized protein n=1 Tax=Niveibacterium umoris TaxID=1193620 RepID=A0A840BP41_9RHOO|nr:hypothetical protein [Niveibacterium umoris]MBB4012616.1 hypothetical protein [Niveibacterium umoris]
MTPARILLAVVIAILLTWGVSVSRDLHRVALPFGTADLSSIKPKLDKLPKEERELVYGYVRRSKGDYLTPQFADPDEPFTARTVGEAIKLQRNFLKLMAERDAKQQARQAERDAAMAPLREALAVDLVKRELVPAGLVYKTQITDEMRAKRPVDEHEVLVTTYRVQNTSDTKIAELRATVDVKRLHKRESDFLPLDHCYITRAEPLEPGQEVEVRCSETRRAASDADRDYIAMPGSELLLVWEPKYIRFANGRELEFRD